MNREIKDETVTEHRGSWYSVVQSDRNSFKTDTFHKPTTYEPHVYTSFEQKILLPDTNTDE